MEEEALVSVVAGIEINISWSLPGEHSISLPRSELISAGLEKIPIFRISGWTGLHPGSVTPHPSLQPPSGYIIYQQYTGWTWNSSRGMLNIHMKALYNTRPQRVCSGEKRSSGGGDLSDISYLAGELLKADG